MASRLCFTFTILLMSLSCLPCQAQLSSTFYDRTCPSALSTIRGAISAAVSREQRMAASLIRLHFHDCFVRGCDGSVLLDDTSSMNGEKNSLSNANSLRGFDVIENVKVGGPSWAVKLGRRDCLTASRDLADQNLPRFTNSLSELTSSFSSKNLNQRDLVAPLGWSTYIGQAKCFSFRDRVNSNASDIDPELARSLREDLPCPADGSGNANLAPFDALTPNTFDNSYFRNLVDRKGLIP
ncbi:hypothetical protein GH714_001495 [Hevea brasiliensis]|uniref:peroxidase n=1 Tax=Hevea brasiliensis TaxID=3981 RepID=A0A6A6KZ97_HEVBR|nr:hypothetical protein GH714_001495 [Hevea brasiliensis]